MNQLSIEKVAVVIPNLNGAQLLSEAIDSLLDQTFICTIIVVENASTDNSLQVLNAYGDKITIIKNKKNLGFAGGVNVGIRYALDKKFDAVALFNNDAVADSHWLEELVEAMSKSDKIAIATCKIKLSDGKTLDSTGEFFTSWGLPYPRGRGEPVEKYQDEEFIFGASGGASLYRASFFEKVGLFDETFFAYYEDTDISFRAQLAGYKIRYTPKAFVHHAQGQTSKRMPGDFTIFQTFKNLPVLYLKNVPSGLLFKIGIRFYLAYLLILGKAIANGKGVASLKGALFSLKLLPHTLRERSFIQKHRTVSTAYITSIIVHDLPPNQTGIRKLRHMLRRK